MLYYIYTNQDLRTLCSDSELSKSTLLLDVFIVVPTHPWIPQNTLVLRWLPCFMRRHMMTLGTHFPLPNVIGIHFKVDTKWAMVTYRSSNTILITIYSKREKKSMYYHFSGGTRAENVKKENHLQKSAWHANFMYSWQLTLRFQQPAL